jgi:ribose 1,5-bisphosphate isomerase
MDDEERIHEAVETTAEKIAAMDVRGAATIAAAVADALETQATQSDAATVAECREELTAAARRLHDTRPTAVSLANALRTVLRDLDRPGTVAELRESVQDRATAFREELDDAQERLGRIGANRLRDGDTVMTHCHSTAVMAALEEAVERGIDVTAIVKETRPRRQGRITARQLDELGVPVTFIVDGAATSYLDETDHVFVGADSVTADGHVVNKIGTAGLGAAAADRNVPLVCHASTIKLHPETLTGHTVPIEQRDPEEVLQDPTAADLAGISVANPAFDVTPPRHVDAIVTEHGQFPPHAIITLMRERFGETTEQPWA